MKSCPKARIVALLGVMALSPIGGAVPAAASGLPPVEPPEAGPGISVTGIGFARTSPREGASPESAAVTRAVRDAGRRAGAIAGALGIQAGGVETVELRALSQFGERSPAGIAAAAATVTFAIVGGADGSAVTREAHAYGEASSPVEPADADRSVPIKRALLDARRAATPEAAAAARRNAQAAAGSSGLSLGAVISISEAPALYYGYGFYDSALGSFGPGRFCGYFKRPVIRRDPKTGASRVVRRVRRRGCAFPNRYGLQLEIAYAAA